MDNFPPPLILSRPLDNGLVARKTGHPLSANSNNILSAILSHTPCGLSSLIQYHFFSEPGPMNDHCPCHLVGKSCNKPITCDTGLIFTAAATAHKQRRTLHLVMTRVTPVAADSLWVSAISRTGCMYLKSAVFCDETDEARPETQQSEQGTVLQTTSSDCHTR